ncbi:tautomerase family protein [Oceanirhabdus seepicola]|uniref:Tautomerase family protein n=1 Tax=Oceanirhabdus seepicola TaxID=2828781 RepID=A0A9J6P529_9CLOT|nr:tautomerase family protein [Oceanirhabdus seepicola]MCM1991193.1 tautomerase family protein [Oceanirhabdus seepicola]
MPVINVTSGPMTTEEKKELIRRLTEVSMEITGTPEHGNSVLINELPLDALGIGKKTAAEVFAQK